MDNEAPDSQQIPDNSSENPPLMTEKISASIMTSASPILVETSTQNQFILLQKQHSTAVGAQASQPTVQHSMSLPQALKGQNITILQPQLFQKNRPQGPRPVVTLTRPGFLPVQVTQAQAILLNSLAQNTTAKHPILPKGASPEKSNAQSSATKQVFMPVSLASGMSSSTTLTVRPIAPRFAAAILQGTETDKNSRTQTTFVPRAIAPQPNQILIPAQVGQGGPVVLRPNSLNASSLKNLTNNVLRIQGPSGQMMQAVITAPMHNVQSSNTQESIIAGNQSKPGHAGDEPINGSDIVVDAKPVKKPCNCTKSQCLKLYCDCFANGEFCNNCNCNNCSNNIQHEAERSKAIKACLERNPFAFHPKIGKTRGIAERRHTKGCHCKRSGCLKNYCECYEAKIMCSALCKCTGCKNFEESPERKTLMHLADAAEVRVLQQNAARSKLESQLEAATSKSISTTSEKRLPFTFITTPVVNATCECLMATAEEAELNNISEQKAERLLLDEFGRSLMQIIQTANKSKDYSI